MLSSSYTKRYAEVLTPKNVTLYGNGVIADAVMISFWSRMGP